MSIAKRDVLELRRRMTKKGCTIDRLCGCYVDGGKNVVLKFNESFSDLPEEEYYKYLDIAKKAMSGSLNSNLLELSFQRGETGDEHQRYLYTLKASKMQNPELLERLRCEARQDFSTILESWMECCPTMEETLAQEDRWARESVAYLQVLPALRG